MGEGPSRGGGDRNLVNRYPKRLTFAAAEAVAQEVGRRQATLYRRIGGYRRTRTIEGLRGPVSAGACVASENRRRPTRRHGESM